MTFDEIIKEERKLAVAEKQAEFDKEKKEAIAEVEKDTKEDIVLRMYQNSFPVNEIALATGISEERINEIIASV